MSRIALSSLERAQREILPLDLALYHAARDYPGGAAAIAATTGRNQTTLQHKLSPTHPSHSINIQEFGEILELTKDRRILDAVHALVSAQSEPTNTAAPPLADPAHGQPPDFQKARAHREHYLARMAEMEFR